MRLASVTLKCSKNSKIYKLSTRHETELYFFKLKSGLQICLARQTGGGKGVISPDWEMETGKNSFFIMVVYISYNVAGRSGKVLKCLKHLYSYTTFSGYWYLLVHSKFSSWEHLHKNISNWEYLLSYISYERISSWSYLLKYNYIRTSSEVHLFNYTKFSRWEYLLKRISSWVYLLSYNYIRISNEVHLFSYIKFSS